MHDATRLAAAALLAGLAGCSEAGEESQAANETNVADVDVLPADESVATSSGELVNGVNDPDVNELGNQH